MTRPARAPSSTAFPPIPRSFRARSRELATLERAVLAGHPARLALIGAGGSGKSTLAAALGHKVKKAFPGGIHWFRVGAWDERTLAEMLAIRFRVPLVRPRVIDGLQKHLATRGATFVVLDNHEDDKAIAALLDSLRGVPVTFLITARRCLLAGVSVFPVVAPLVTTGESPFPSVAEITRLLRWNPLALDLADALVSSGAIPVGELRAWLSSKGVDRVQVIAHEDDLPEVRLLVAWSWGKISATAKRMLAVLAHTGGDHMDEASLMVLSHAGKGKKGGGEALGELKRFRLVQEPFQGRYALHATVRYALTERTKGDPRAEFEHYVGLLEREPERLDLEQTHLFASMDYANVHGDLGAALRVNALLSRLEEGSEDETEAG